MGVCWPDTMVSVDRRCGVRSRPVERVVGDPEMVERCRGRVGAVHSSLDTDGCRNAEPRAGDALTATIKRRLDVGQGRPVLAVRGVSERLDCFVVEEDMGGHTTAACASAHTRMFRGVGSRSSRRIAS